MDEWFLKENGGFDVSITSASVSSGAKLGLKGLRIVATVDCHIEVGENPTATTSKSHFVAAYAYPEIIPFKPGDKIAVIRSAADGTLHCSAIV